MARDVSASLKAIREKHGLPGMAAVLVKDGHVVAQGCDGVRKRGSSEKVTLGDKFHIGSCTKSMTATMIATLVEEGKLRWTTTVGEIVRDLGMKVHAGWDRVNLEQLLAHRGGAPADIEEDLWARLWTHSGTPSEQRQALADGVLMTPPRAPGMGNWSYSNAGYALAGWMAEKVTGRSWEIVMEERLFRPLGMESAGFGAPGTAGSVGQPRGRTEAGEPVEVGPGSDNPAAIAPAGTVHCSLGDWAKYVSAHLHRGMLLKAESFAHLQRPREGPDPRYAMGWIVLHRDWGGGQVLMHNGSNTMWFAVCWLAPKKGLAVFIATNQGGDKAERACDDAAGALLDGLSR